VRHGSSVSFAWQVAVPEDMERSTTTCPCAADMPGAENMPVPFHADRRWGFSNERFGIMFHGNAGAREAGGLNRRVCDGVRPSSPWRSGPPAPAASCDVAGLTD
jgi:hypothetical protein